MMMELTMYDVVYVLIDSKGYGLCQLTYKENDSVRESHNVAKDKISRYSLTGVHR
jgi:hypothetical protein